MLEDLNHAGDLVSAKIPATGKVVHGPRIHKVERFMTYRHRSNQHDNEFTQRNRWLNTFHNAFIAMQQFADTPKN